MSRKSELLEVVFVGQDPPDARRIRDLRAAFVMSRAGPLLMVAPSRRGATRRALNELRSALLQGREEFSSLWARREPVAAFACVFDLLCTGERVRWVESPADRVEPTLEVGYPPICSHELALGIANEYGKAPFSRREAEWPRFDEMAGLYAPLKTTVDLE